jgi:putative molybdopterin biosynthesis protein
MAEGAAVWNTQAVNVQEVADILKIARNTVYVLSSGASSAARRSARDARLPGGNRRLSAPDDGQLRAARKLPAVRKCPHWFRTAAGEGTGREELIRGGELIICGQDVSLDILITHLIYDNTKGFRPTGPIWQATTAFTRCIRAKVNVATAHLWDGDTDSYKCPYIKKMMPGTPAVIVRIGQADGGAVCAGGKSEKFRRWEDLAQSGLTSPTGNGAAEFAFCWTKSCG